MKNEVVITAADYQRLKELIRTARMSWPYGAYVNALERELRRARIVPPDHVPEDVGTMNSRVRLRDLNIDERAIYAVVYPIMRMGMRTSSPFSRRWRRRSWATAWATWSAAPFPPVPAP